MPMLPAEWAPQGAVMLTWPHPQTDWLRILDRVEPVFVAIAKAVTAHEKLVVACHDEPWREHIAELLAAAGVPPERVQLHLVSSNDSWVRDHGPLTVTTDEGGLRLLDFRFNGWGRKYDHDLDDLVTTHLHEAGAFGSTPLEPVALVLEGGSIESDGLGTILTTTHCLLSPERNPEYDCVGLEGIFAQVFGSQRVLWLEHGALIGDDTDGHIDTLARFCDPHTIAYVTCEDPTDPHYEPLRQMAEELRDFTDAGDRPYRLVELPLPAAKYDDEGQRLPATHANFLIINGAVLVPTYDDPTDAIALERLAACFPDREVIAIDALPLIHQYGSIHCVTMQLPAGVV